MQGSSLPITGERPYGQNIPRCFQCLLLASDVIFVAGLGVDQIKTTRCHGGSRAFTLGADASRHCKQREDRKVPIALAHLSDQTTGSYGSVVAPAPEMRDTLPRRAASILLYLEGRVANIVEQYASTITQIYHSVASNYKLNQQILEQANGEINDLLHEIELANPKNAREGYVMYKSLRDARIRRRKAKEENELLQELYDFLQSQSAFRDRMTKIQGGAARLYETQSHRTYVPRQRTDLTIVGSEDKPYKPFEEMLRDFKETKVSMKGGKLRK